MIRLQPLRNVAPVAVVDHVGLMLVMMMAAGPYCYCCSYVVVDRLHLWVEELVLVESRVSR